MLTPWNSIEDEIVRAALGAQLVREVGPRHMLFGLPARLIARRQDNDDCLFALEDGRVAHVHLTWRKSRESDPRWPAAILYDTLEHWTEAVLAPDNRQWERDANL